MVEQQDVIIDESENWKGGKTNSHKEIVLSQVKRITTISSQEFRAGWWKKATPSPGLNMDNFIVYYPDTREEYSNAVEVLHDLLFAKFSGETEKEIDKINKILYLLRKKYENKEYDKETYRYKRRLHSRKLFQAMCKFMENLGWLESGTIEE